MRGIFLLLLLTYVSSSHAESCDTHPWNNNLPSILNEKSFKAITDLAEPVIESEITTAKNLLKEEQSTRISDEKASLLLGRKFENKTAYQMYLVRALRDNINANIVVYRYLDNLLMESISMEQSKNVIESPQLVLLDSAPAKVYVTCIKVM